MATGMAGILRALESHRTIFDADVIGEKVLDAAAECQIREFESEHDADGNPWDALSDQYYFWKEQHAHVTDIGVLYGLLGEEENFYNPSQRTIMKDRATAVFGATARAQDEAEWFMEGDPSQNRPPRPFLGLSADAIAKITDLLEKHHKKSLS